jgi:flagellar basal body-associated protein FliL
VIYIPKNNKKQKKSAIIIILSLVFVIVGTLVFYMFYVYEPPSGSSMVRIPVIRTTLESQRDGLKHNVETQFHVQIDSNALRSVSRQVLEDALAKIMLDMDYDTISAPGGVDYMNQFATEALNAYLEEHETRVVVTGITTGDRIQLPDDDSRGADALRGIFRNMD